MSVQFRIMFNRKGLCLFLLATSCLLNIQSASAWAPLMINFNSHNGDSTEPVALAILGEVKNPATYQVSPKDATLGQLIHIAGGTTPIASREVHVIRGGKSLLALLRPSQDNFKLLPGDIVVQSQLWNHSTLSRSSTTAGSGPVVYRASGQQNVHHGHIVLLGLADKPIVLPLWDLQGKTLTVDSLLTGLMKQPPQVAANTKIIFAQHEPRSNQIKPGMILSVPEALVLRENLPSLPLPIVPENQTTAPESLQNKIEQPQNKQSEPVNIALTQTEQTAPSESSVPSAIPLMLTPPNQTSENQSNKLDFEHDVTDPFSQEDQGTDLTEQTSSKQFHLAKPVESVPDPSDPKQAESPSMIGFIAGAFVVIGVITVIFSALRNHWTQSKHHHFEESAPLAEQVATTITAPVAEKPPKRRRQFSQPEAAVASEALPAIQVPTEPVSDPLTRAKQEKEDGLQALLENQIPIIEEQVLMQRELKFFGKPNLYYEFRIDASHEISKPHVVLASKKTNQLETQIFWEGEAGLFVSPYELYQEVTPSDR